MQAMHGLPPMRRLPVSPVAETERRYRVAEVAALLNVDPSTVYRMIYARLLDAERHGRSGGAIRVTARAVSEYLAAAKAVA